MAMPPTVFAAVDPSLGPLYVLTTIAFVGLVGWLLVRARKSSAARDVTWKKLDAALGLRQVGERAWRAEVEGLHVSIESIARKHDSKSATFYDLKVTIAGLPSDVHLGAQGFFALLTERDLGSIKGADVPIGDPDFDDAITVKGDVSAALALLDVETRALIRSAIADEWRLSGGAWRHLATGGRGVDDVHAHVQRGLDLARRVRAASGDVVARLSRIAFEDPLASVRQRVLERLFAAHRDAPESQAAFVAARADQDPNIRRLVAFELRDVAMLLTLAGDDPDPGRRVEALDALVHLAETAAVDCRESALEVAHQWIAHTRPELRCAALRAFDRLPTPQAEGPCIAALADHDEAVRLAAINALAALGTVAAVPALTPLREGLFDTSQKSAAARAITMIQGRVGPASVGALALAEADGALALSDG